MGQVEDETEVTEDTLNLTYEEKVEHINEIASPLATKKLSKRLYKLITAANEEHLVTQGLRDCLKSIKKGGKGLVVLAGDVSPIDTYSHVPIYLEDRDIPYIYLPSRKDMGVAIGSKKTSCILLIERSDDIGEYYDKCVKMVRELVTNNDCKSIFSGNNRMQSICMRSVDETAVCLSSKEEELACEVKCQFPFYYKDKYFFDCVDNWCSSTSYFIDYVSPYLSFANDDCPRKVFHYVNENCGKEDIEIKPVKKYGEIDGVWKWFVSITIMASVTLNNNKTISTNVNRCDGIVIDKEWIMTNVKCFRDADEQLIYSNISSSNSYLYISINGKNSQVQTVIIHPLYNNRYHEIALIKYYSSEEITPICLIKTEDVPNDRDFIISSNIPSPNTEGYLVGKGLFKWTKTDKNQSIKFTSYRVIPNEKCGHLTLYSHEFCITSDYWLSDHEINKNLCFNNLGNSFIIYDSSSKRFSVIGIIIQFTFDCKYARLTKVVDYNGWINGIIPPECKIPFNYGDAQLHDCTNGGEAREPWCSLDETYVPGSNNYLYCRNSTCQFPFEREGQLMFSCVAGGYYWCSIYYDYLFHQTFRECDGTENNHELYLQTIVGECGVGVKENGFSLIDSTSCGYQAKDGFPWLGILVIYGRIERTPNDLMTLKLTHCVATMIHSDYFLTSYSCYANVLSIINRYFPKTKSELQWRIYTDVKDGNDISYNSNKKYSTVSKAYHLPRIHENIQNDILILKVSESVPPQIMSPVCIEIPTITPPNIPEMPFTRLPEKGTEAFVVGWKGTRRPTVTITNLLKRFYPITVVERSKCKFYLSKHEFCSKSEKQPSINDQLEQNCRYDIGSPIVSYNGKVGTWRMIGMVSFTDYEVREDIGKGRLTNMMDYSNWIFNVITGSITPSSDIIM
ncbi:hypothetical protein SNEBB_004054 [Seison nebaliae]|nr:hypothetical protein SNEBB_004054 [Seison nebaliae]